MYRLNSVERRERVEKLKEYEGEVIQCKVKHITGKYIVEWGDMEIEVDTKDAIPGEKLIKEQKYLFCVERIRDNVELSRASNLFIAALLKYFVPEIKSGEIEIVKLVRKPGFKTVVMIRGPKNPVGICVGPDGMRIKNVVKEARGEKIEVVDANEGLEAIIEKIASKGVETVVKDFVDRVVILVKNKEFIPKLIGRQGLNTKIMSEFVSRAVEVHTVNEFAEESQIKREEIAQHLKGIGVDETTAEKIASKLQYLKYFNSISYAILCEILDEADARRVFAMLVAKECHETKLDDAFFEESPQTKLFELIRQRVQE